MKKFVFLGNPPGKNADGSPQRGPQPGEIGRFGMMQPGTIVPLSTREAETVSRDKDRRFEPFDPKRHKEAKRHPNDRLWDEEAARLQDLTESPIEKLRGIAEARGLRIDPHATKAELVLAISKVEDDDEEAEQRRASGAVNELARMTGVDREDDEKQATGK